MSVWVAKSVCKSKSAIVNFHIDKPYSGRRRGIRVDLRHSLGRCHCVLNTNSIIYNFGGHVYTGCRNELQYCQVPFTAMGDVVISTSVDVFCFVEQLFSVQKVEVKLTY